MYEYETCCVNSTAKLINDMVDQAREITWETFRRHVHWTEVRRVFPFYSYRGVLGHHIKDDWHVGFWKSRYSGAPCYYITHSAIEYIFTEI